MLERRRLIRRKKKLDRTLGIMRRDMKSYIGLGIILLIIVIAIFAPLLSPHDPYQIDVRNKFQSPSFEHPAGTDNLGRDLLSRLFYSARPALIVALGGISIASIGGIILGSIAAYLGGIVDNAIIFIFDIIKSFPPMVFVLALISIVGPSIINLILIMGITVIPRYGRVVRAETLSIKEEEYVEISRAFGAKTVRVISKHIIPNLFPSVLVLAGMDTAHMIMWEAGLSFLGLGVQPPKTSWGLMFQEGYKYLESSAYMLIWPALVIILAMVGFSTFAESLRIALNPKSEETIKYEQ